MEKQKQIIYGYDRMQVYYEFEVVREDNDYLYIKDISTTWYALKNNIFTIDKETLTPIASESKEFVFIIKPENELTLSFDIKDIENKIAKEQIDLLREENKRIIEVKMPKMKEELATIGEVEKVDYENASFELGEKVYVVDEYGNLCEGEVSGIILRKGGESGLRVNVLMLGIFDGILQYSTIDEKLITYVSDDSFFGETEYETYLSKEDFEMTKKMRRKKELESRLGNGERRIVENERKIEEWKLKIC